MWDRRSVGLVQNPISRSTQGKQSIAVDVILSVAEQAQSSDSVRAVQISGEFSAKPDAFFQTERPVID